MSRARQLRIRDMIVQLARETGAYRIEVDADESPQLFGSDSFHLNQEGHRWVAEQMWAVYKRLPCAPRQLTRAGAGRAGLDNGPPDRQTQTDRPLSTDTHTHTHTHTNTNTAHEWPGEAHTRGELTTHAVPVPSQPR